MSRAQCILCALCSALCATARPIRAADTVETWAVGATNVDFYLGMDGVGLEEYDKSLYGDIMLGYGLVDRFSAYIGVTLSANEYFAQGDAGLCFGLFGTPVETDHFDLDLFLDISGSGDGFDDFSLSPSLELNLDLDPDMRSLGFYLQAGLPIYGVDVSGGGDSGSAYEAAVAVEGRLGAYLTIRDAHQIHAAYDMTFRPMARVDERAVDVGGVALGYNVFVHDAIELIHQIYLDLPLKEDAFSVGFMAGLIASLPGSQ